jgi:hypothetical protein
MCWLPLCLSSLLQGQHIYVCVSNALFSYYPQNGVLQGSILSVTLFTIEIKMRQLAQFAHVSRYLHVSKTSQVTMLPAALLKLNDSSSPLKSFVAQNPPPYSNDLLCALHTVMGLAPFPVSLP